MIASFRTRVCLFAAGAAFLASHLATFAEDGFRPLFNGRDLTGWVNVNCAPETWSVKDGMVLCTGFPTGALRTEKQYENFIFEAEWRHMKSGGNAGIFIWSSPIAATGQPFLRAIEVQVLDHGYGNTDNYTTHGDVFPIHGSTMKPFGRHRGMRSFPSENRSKPSPEWNHYRVECRDGVLRLQVNGKEVSGGEDCVWRKGYLALESEGAPVEWRNLRIKELPGSAATAEQTAPEAQGHRSLYTGVDLRGWKVPAGDRWKAADWRLTLRAGEATEPLWSEGKFANSEFIVDCRLPEKAAPGAGEPALLLGKGDRSVRVPLTGTQGGKWSRFVVTVTDGKATVAPLVSQTPNAAQAVELPAGPYSFGLESGAGAVEFANIYVRPL
jgi:hypothetical protein